MTTQSGLPAYPDVDFDGLTISWDARTLRPRPWTAAQSRWAAELSPGLPQGPILELCCGAGHIGLLAAHLTGRELVQVDRDPAAVAYARANAAAAGVATEIRFAPVEQALTPGEAFPLVIVDPPWLTSDQLDAYPEDPPGAVDGGPDGLDAVRLCLRVALAHVLPAGAVLLQIGYPGQVDRVVEEFGLDDPAGDGDVVVTEVRDLRPGGVLVHLTRSRRAS
ncbi:methyltransferase [Nocardioides daejeonensis]|uniref:methyltransferase n=1 Tax=Nocardioides daejeonensis TaxID=1046556 RepID=UPI000D7414E4|nr:methyltransferase [Nocardioides daejeonensis]